MAVTKMKKVTMISDKTRQEAVLQALQGLQNVEIRDLSKSTESNAWVQEYFSASFDQMIETREAEFNDLQKDLAEALHFIEYHGTQQKKESLKRQYISLQEMEAVFDEREIKEELAEILSLKEKWNENQDKKRELSQKEEWLAGWQSLDVNPNAVISKFVAFYFVSISSYMADDFFHDLKQFDLVYPEEIFQDKKDTHIAMVYHQKTADELQELFSRFSVQVENYPYDLPPKEMIQDIKRQLAVLEKEAKALTETIGLKHADIKRLQWAEEVILAMQRREQVKKELVQAKYLVVIQGWMSETDTEGLIQELNENVGEDEVYLAFENPNETEINEEVPSKLVNHPLVRPFEMLTEMYSIPKYDEVDPTPWITPFYLVFFGMMVADAGYGLLVLVATTVALKKMVLTRGMEKYAKFFQFLSIPTIIWGLIYGSFFGVTLPYKPLLSASDNVIQILMISVAFGFIQILVGLFIAAKEHIKHKEYLSAISDGFAWHGILIGIAVAAAGNMLLDSEALFNVGVGVAVVSAIFVIIVPAIQSKSKIGGAVSGLYDLYGITSYIGDLVSYTRLMAIGVSGGSIAAAFNMLVSYLPPIARFTVGIVLIVALQGLNIFLSLLSAYVHGIRLQYVEFFGKFYTGGGKVFESFKTAEKYVNIETKNKKNND